MDQRPIGVFDSGLGGLTAVRELCRLLPGEDVVYFGDTGRVPYGSRSRETIIKYARQDVAFLRTFDLKAILIACGTVSTTALDVLSAENPIPVMGVVEPAARAAARLTRSGNIGLIGTQTSVRSGAYERAIQAENPAARVTGQPCPLFVPLVENGRFRPGDIVIETVAAEYLAPLKRPGWTPWCWGAPTTPCWRRSSPPAWAPAWPWSAPGRREPGRRRTSCAPAAPCPAGRTAARAASSSATGRRILPGWPPFSWGGTLPRRWSSPISANIAGDPPLHPARRRI